MEQWRPTFVSSMLRKGKKAAAAAAALSVVHRRYF